MPRVTTVKKAQKAQGTCGKCGAKIKKGDSYRWWKFRFGGRRVRCAKPECTPKPSDLTQSAFYGTLYSIEESVTDAIADFEGGGEPDALADALRQAAEELRELGEECTSNRDNMPEGLQDSETGELLQNRADECESKADELESAADEVEGLEIQDDTAAFAESEGLTPEENESEEAFQARLETAMEAANEEARSGVIPDVDLGID